MRIDGANRRVEHLVELVCTLRRILVLEVQLQVVLHGRHDDLIPLINIVRDIAYHLEDYHNTTLVFRDRPTVDVL